MWGRPCRAQSMIEAVVMVEIGRGDEIEDAVVYHGFVCSHLTVKETEDV